MQNGFEHPKAKQFEQYAWKLQHHPPAEHHLTSKLKFLWKDSLNDEQICMHSLIQNESRRWSGGKCHRSSLLENTYFLFSKIALMQIKVNWKPLNSKLSITVWKLHKFNLSRPFIVMTSYLGSEDIGSLAWEFQKADKWAYSETQN